MNGTVNERELSYPIYIDLSMCNARGALYPTAYQRIIIETIGLHLEKIGLDSPRLTKAYGVAWVLLSMSVALRRPIRVDDKLTMKTWSTHFALPVCRREIAIYDEAGETVAVGAAFSSLLDMKTHRICMDKEMLGRFALPEGEALIESDRRFTERLPFTLVEERPVRPSWIDGLGHVNNERYGEFVYDALTPAERQNIGALTRLDVWFRTELAEGETFTVERAESGSAVVVRGMIQPAQRESFIMKLTF